MRRQICAGSPPIKALPNIWPTCVWASTKPGIMARPGKAIASGNCEAGPTPVMRDFSKLIAQSCLTPSGVKMTSGANAPLLLNIFSKSIIASDGPSGPPVLSKGLFQGDPRRIYC